MPGEIACDQPIVNPEDRFRINVFYQIYDTILGELESRFEDYHTVVQKFACLMPQNISKNTSNLLDEIEHLASFYEKDVDKDLVISEYKQLQNFLSESEMFHSRNPQTVQDMLLTMKETDLNNLYPNLTVMYLIL